MKKQDIIILTSIVVVLITIRAIFNIPNFNPIGAIALMGGVLFQKRSNAFLITLGALFLGDFMLGLSSPTYMEYIFSATFLFVYISFIFIIMLGMVIKNRVSLLSVITGSIISAIIFFLALDYSKSFSGLMSSYAAGVPFFRATLVSQLLFSVGIYVLYNLATQRKTSVA
jgi:hypothetical protein